LNWDEERVDYAAVNIEKETIAVVEEAVVLIGILPDICWTTRRWPVGTAAKA
jgi:hypothetical protein